MPTHLLCTLQVLADANRVDFLIRDLAHPARTLQASHSVLQSERREVDALLDRLRDELERAAAPPTPTLEALGDRLASALLPRAVQQLLCDARLDGSVLTIESNAQGIPWELIRLTGSFLWERFVTNRAEITRGTVRFANDVAGRSHRILLIADPDGTLPAARDEVDFLTRLVASHAAWRLDVLAGDQASSGRILEALQSGDYEVVHFSCQAHWDADQPEASRIFLADEPLPARRLSDLTLAAPPSAVIANMCQTAGLGGAAWDRSGWARVFLDLGADTVITPLWNIQDSWSASLVASFYRHWLAGDACGEALRSARRLLLSRALPDPYATPHAYVLYGNPFMRLVPQPTPQPAPVPPAETAPWQAPARFHLRVVAGPEEGRVILLADSTMLEGRSIALGRPGGRQNEIAINDPGMSHEEGRLEFHNGAWHYHAHNGVAHINGQPLDGTIRLRLGDSLRLGNSVLRLAPGGPR